MLSIVQTQADRRICDIVAVSAELGRGLLRNLGQSHCSSGKCHVVIHHLIYQLPQGCGLLPAQLNARLGGISHHHALHTPDRLEKGATAAMDDFYFAPVWRNAERSLLHQSALRMVSELQGLLRTQGIQGVTSTGLKKSGQTVTTVLPAWLPLLTMP